MANRRSSERITLTMDDHDPLVGPWSLLNIGTGGFAVESPEIFHPGEERSFEFALADGFHVTLRATVVHCLRVNRLDAPPIYIAGFASLGLADGTAVEDVIDAIIGSFSAVAAAS